MYQAIDSLYDVFIFSIFTVLNDDNNVMLGDVISCSLHQFANVLSIHSFLPLFLLTLTTLMMPLYPILTGYRAASTQSLKGIFTVGLTKGCTYILSKMAKRVMG